MLFGAPTFLDRVYLHGVIAMRHDTNTERKNREYKEVALRFRGEQRELLERLNAAQESGQVDDIKNCLSELETAALSLLKLREGYSAKLDFIREYQIEIRDDGRVSVVIPAGVSRTDFLRHAQNIAHELYGVFAVFPPRLAQWERFPTLVEYGGEPVRCTATEKVAVQLGLPDSGGMTLREQLEFLQNRNLAMASVIDTVVASAAYLVVTGEPAVARNVILRAAGGCVQVDENGAGLRGIWETVAAPTILVAVNAEPF